MHSTIVIRTKKKTDLLGGQVKMYGAFDAEGPCGTKVIHDPIHGLIHLPKPILELVDTNQFQRLRELSQLGATYYVFPGATHRRFEHSLGVSHLAAELLQNIRLRQPELEISDRDCLRVQAAGLCHDLGHGPFSHMFDSEFIRITRPERKWTHEQGSLMMLRNLIDENNIDICKEDVRIIEDLICPPNLASERLIKEPQKQFLYDVVANSRNSVDVDKFDYLKRDSYCLGMTSSYDGNRLMNMCRVIDDQICYHVKEAYNVYQLFHTRFGLHKQVYTHRVSKAVEYMICDAMLEADSVLGISKSIDDPQRYLHMTDAIVPTIEFSTDPNLAKARSILNDVRHRRLYKAAREIILPKNATAALKHKNIDEDELSTYQKGSHLTGADLKVQRFQIDFSMKHDNPVERVRYFTWDDCSSSYKIETKEISSIISENCSEDIVRVYVRRPTPEKLAAAAGALEAYLRANTGIDFSQASSPGKDDVELDSFV